MNNETFMRKSAGLVNTDLQALRAAKARKLNTNRMFMLEARLEAIEEKIDDLIKGLERLNRDE